MAFVVHHTLTDVVVAVCDESFIEDIVTDFVCPTLGLFRDRTLYEGQTQGAFYNHTIRDDAVNLAADACLVAVDDAVSDIGNVMSDIYGNELATQKQTAGAHS